MKSKLSKISVGYFFVEAVVVLVFQLIAFIFAILNGEISEVVVQIPIIFLTGMVAYGIYDCFYKKRNRFLWVLIALQILRLSSVVVSIMLTVAIFLSGEGYLIFLFAIFVGYVVIQLLLLPFSIVYLKVLYRRKKEHNLEDGEVKNGDMAKGLNMS